MTHWLDHSLVLASDYRIPQRRRSLTPPRSRPGGWAGVGAHHVLTYASITEPDRVLVILALHRHEPVPDLLRSPAFFDLFDAAGVDDLPAVFAGELIERLDLAGESRTAAPEVMVSMVTPVIDPVGLVVHIRETVDDLRKAGVRGLSAFSALDDAHEAMLLLQIGDESHARHWLRDSALAAEWLVGAGIGAYPPVFVGRLAEALRVGEGDGRDDR